MFLFLQRRVVLLVSAAGWLLLLSASAQASIVINTTRIIYPASDKEVSFGVHNVGNKEILVQSWLEPTAEYADPNNLPFVITPAIARLPGDGRQLVRIIHAGMDMPQDRESVLWLNVQEIPQVAAQNTLQIAIRQRMKLFFRPKGLAGDAAEAPDNLRWKLTANNTVHVENPGPFHVSMVMIAVQRAGSELLSKDSQMIAPGQQLQLPLSSPGDGAVLSFISINDFGGQIAYRAALKTGEITRAVKVEPR
ncbi:pilus assembly protein [Pseudomonas sp. S25]|uniref:Pilus assembly protein n=1 Tax=Pseudomonas maioricensis TaxID=1766623 RepID=A0ABS9ZIL7_9PSED|nr:molecular chaperone [Pseudomonas sp. S25]MCI8210171.1 pilus assembly protein [Pseudomonas sp. S25]